jgi:GDP-L-fucose synthase
MWGKKKLCNFVTTSCIICLVIMEKWEDPEHINVGAGVDLTIRELVEKVREIVFPEANLVFDHSKPDGTPQKLLNIDRLANLGWNPVINFTEGIKNTYEWYLSQAG